MTLTSLTTFESRIAVMLFDIPHRIFSLTAIDEGLRQALSEYGIFAGAQVEVALLDNAGITTVPQLHESIIVTGAAAYTASSHALQPVDASGLQAWAQAQLTAFRQFLTLLFALPSHLVSTSAPYSPSAWLLPDEDQAEETTSEGDTSMSDPTVTVVVATIAPAASLSDTIYTGGLPLCGIQMPAAWTAADLTFQVSCDVPANVANLYDQSGAELVIKAAASQFVAVDPSYFAGARFIVVRSGTSGTPVAQASQRLISLAIRTV